jgi:hypothetical protein
VKTTDEIMGRATLRGGFDQASDVFHSSVNRGGANGREAEAALGSWWRIHRKNRLTSKAAVQCVQNVIYKRTNGELQRGQEAKW